MSKFYRLRGYIECGDTEKALAYLEHIEPYVDGLLKSTREGTMTCEGTHDKPTGLVHKSMFNIIQLASA